MRGRKPKPVALKLLAGNPGCRPLPEELSLPPADIRIPKEIKGRGFVAARKEWNALAPLLSRAGVTKATDRTALLLYVQALQRYVDATEEIKTQGLYPKTKSGYIQIHPAHAVMRTAVEQMLKLMAEFGLTPSTRSRIKPEKTPEENPLDALIGRAGKR